MGTQHRQERKQIALTKSFVPQFWDEADGRCAIVKEIKRRYEQLKRDTGTESYQQDLLCQRAIFIAAQLETMETAAAERGELDPGVYTQMTNTLMGILKALGLDRKMKKVVDLKAYVEAKQ